MPEALRSNASCWSLHSPTPFDATGSPSGAESLSWLALSWLALSAQQATRALAGILVVAPRDRAGDEGGGIAGRVLHQA